MRTRLKGVLTLAQEARSYHLVGTEHFVELWRRDRCVAVFSTGVTPQKPREAAERDWLRKRVF